MEPTQDINVEETAVLISPLALKSQLPIGAAAHRTVVEGRAAVQKILSKEDKRLLLVVGPCSIHDSKAALEYAQRLHEIHRQVSERLCLVMRVYFEKPRTTVGWKGLINDPHLDGSEDMPTGLRQSRQLLLEINQMGLPTATEMLDPITPQYIADLVSWAAVGARTTESQTHREMASGLSMPVGFKNSTEGNLQIAIDAMESARNPHSFLGIDQEGRTCVVKTRGNAWGHLILRGGNSGPNYDCHSVGQAVEALAATGLEPALLVDTSHANSGKKYQRQEGVFHQVIDQRSSGNEAIIGLMVESNLREGNQPLKAGTDLASLEYGVSVTDECVGWETTERMIWHAYETLAGVAEAVV